MSGSRPAAKHPLATRSGISLVVGLLMASGSLCPKCGYGTRATSKRWAKCKKCGHARIPRCAIADVKIERRAGIPEGHQA